MGVLHKISSSFSIKCIFACLAIFIIPTLLVFSLLYNEAKKASYEEATAFISSNLMNVVKSYEEMLKSTNLYHLHPLNDKKFLEYNTTLSLNRDINSYAWMDSQTRLRDIINSYLMPNREIDSIYLYNTGANIFYSCSYYSKTQRINFSNLPQEQTAEILDFIGVKYRREFAIKPELDGGALVVTSSSHINRFNPMDPPTYFSINLDFDRLATRIVQSMDKKDLAFQITDALGNAVQFDRESLQIQPRFRYNQPVDTFQPEKIRGFYPDTILFSYVGDYSGFTYTVKASMAQFSSTPILIQKASSFLFVTLLAILLVTLLASSLYIVRPIKKVCAAMNLVERGDLRVRLSVTRDDELGYIQTSFNQMLHSIETLIDENYAFKLKKQEMELKYIQTQINEHFLYNTLDSIHWIAQKHHVPAIDHIIFNLTAFYRMTLSNGEELIPVSKILQIFTAYMELLHVRLSHRVTLTCHVEEGLAEVKLLKYVFQPLLENAVYHGIQKSAHEGCIDVCFFTRDPTYICCRVTDNGCGVEAEKLRQIQGCLLEGATQDQEAFALQNIASQLRVFYGAQSFITFESTYKRGSTATVYIPKPGRHSDEI